MSSMSPTSPIDFTRRSTAAELMDDEAVGFEEMRGCLVDLARVNRLTLAYRPTLAFLDRLVARGLPAGRPLEIVDVGSGYGDMLREIDAWALRRGVAVSLTGVDLNPASRRAATLATPPGRPIAWVTADALPTRRRAASTWWSAPSSRTTCPTRSSSASSAGWTRARASAGS